jgi:hypothetical protein
LVHARLRRGAPLITPSETVFNTFAAERPGLQRMERRPAWPDSSDRSSASGRRTPKFRGIRDVYNLLSNDS